MIQLFDEKLIKGKTVKTSGDLFDYKIIIFTDNTYIVYTTLYESGGVYVSQDKIDLKPNRNNLEYIFDLGLISKEEYNTLNHEFDLEYEQAEEERERREYERLKLKFEK